LEDDTPALDSSGSAYASDPSRNSGGGYGLGGMGSEGFFRSAAAAADHGRLGPGCASFRTATGIGSTLFLMERALSRVRSTVHTPSCFWLCNVGHVWLRPHHWVLFAAGLDGRQRRHGWVWDFTMTRGRTKSRGAVERTLASFVDALEHAFYAEELARKDGLLQKLDPRVKIVAILPLIVIAALARQLWVIAALFAVAVAVALLSHVPLGTLAKRVWLGVLFFTGLISFPALFLTPGQAIYSLPLLGWTVTAQGLRAAMYLTMRAETAATFSVLLVLCTPWSNVLKALRVLRLPVVLVVVLGMTYRYIFLLLRNAHDMFISRKSRMVGHLDARKQRRAATASAGVLMTKTIQLSGDVYLAMRSRGFQGEVYVLDEFQTHWFDWAVLAVFITMALLAFWFGR
jgi:cobalt/nickel transport system permease protein